MEGEEEEEEWELVGDAYVHGIMFGRACEVGKCGWEEETEGLDCLKGQVVEMRACRGTTQLGSETIYPGMQNTTVVKVPKLRQNTSSAACTFQIRASASASADQSDY